MASVFSSFDSSPLGGFIQSPNLARGAAATGSLALAAFARSSRFDNPYGTIVADSVSIDRTVKQFGKSTQQQVGFFLLKRERIGITFQLAASYGGAAFQLQIEFTGFTNSIEAFAPRAYASNTDDRALYLLNTSWRENLDNLIGDFTYGVTGLQAITIPAPIITARLGAGLSIIIGEDAELAGGGSGGSSPPPTASIGAIGPTGIPNVNVKLLYA